MAKEIEINPQDDHSKIISYAFYDTKAKRYDTPFYCHNDMFAGRHYKMATEKADSMLNTFKEDFELHRIGWFDVFTGISGSCFEIIIHGKNQNSGE